MGMLGNMFGGGGGEASEESLKAAEVTSAYQAEALKYLKEREALPQQFREGALSGLAGAYGLEGGTGTQQDIIDRSIASPLYGQIMGGREAGEEAILRSASATGGLRSGNVQEALYSYNTQLQNKALLQSYNQQIQGLQGLAELPSLAPQIAQTITGIGTTLGQGRVASAQAQQVGSQQGFGNMLGLGQLGLQAYSSGMFSDRRLKKNIKKIGECDGWNIYSWDWNIVAQKMGLTGKTVGVMADEVYPIRADAVSIKDLFMYVNYSRIGLLQGEHYGI